MDSPRAVVLVEGESDRAALLTLAARSGRDLAAERVDVMAMGGVTNVRAFATRYGPHGLGVRLAGLYDAPEQPFVRHGLAAAGLAETHDARDLETLGFFACTPDLEGELIRALGVDAVEAVIEAADETRSLRLLAQMPAQRGWTRHELLRRFLTARSGRKARYAVLLLEALPLDDVPRPWTAVLDATSV
ncbi:ATP-dependent endonuclease [Nocardioides sp. HDW12B]|uniref:TOPRIM nucleotidyl transferase/hydrolase domain-containing protein n=1 Tax=Nocardioides sp. HDW12B TaxID=2714939 RepID=UPI001409894E|nr:TOPRIM nucleotidyl transferase/hydrolase domain-containing protein [Nocardioides sp. HDW12B]QIK65043.1 ATP-dependent endonuclease [Nocardioides sp. HDW12B]